jgi:hypothetical protein
MAARAWQTVVGCGALFGIAAFGCTYVPNQFREDGPAVRAQEDSPTTADVKARYAAAEPRQRGWGGTTVCAESGAVAHLPLYFEDPFEDKGHGRTDETDPHNVYRGGWEDYFAMGYCYARFTGNWLLLPASAIVTTPWTIMESDGKLSRQLLGYDHDAERTPHHVFEIGPPEPVQRREEAAPAAAPEATGK